MTGQSTTVVAMRTSTGRRVRQGLLLCALALAVLGMHHVAFGSHGTPDGTPSGGTHAAAMTMSTNASMEPTAQPADDSGTDTGHELMHLCLAVLCATVGLLLLAWLLMAVSARIRPPTDRLPPPMWHTWRLRGTAGRSLLASVCLLRI